MDINPFIYDDPWVGELIDRKQEVEQLTTQALGSHKTRLVAPRRYGKTSVLYAVRDALHKQGWNTIYVDFYRVMGASQVASRLEAAYATSGNKAKRVVSNLLRTHKLGLKAGVSGAEVGLDTEYTGESDLERRLDALFDLPASLLEKTHKRTLVILDEFQDFLSIDGLDGLLRSKIQFHKDKASYIFAGSEPAMLHAAFEDKKRPFFNQSRPYTLGPLPDDELGEYIDDHLQKARRSSGDGVEMLLDLVRGHPQRGMLLAHHLFEATPRGGTAGVEEFEEALRAARAEIRDSFEDTWRKLPHNQRKLLAVLAAGASPYEKQRRDAVNLKKGSVVQTLAAMTKNGDIYRDAEDRPVIVDPLFEDWVREG